MSYEIQRQPEVGIYQYPSGIERSSISVLGGQAVFAAEAQFPEDWQIAIARLAAGQSFVQASRESGIPHTTLVSHHRAARMQMGAETMSGLLLRCIQNGVVHITEGIEASLLEDLDERDRNAMCLLAADYPAAGTGLPYFYRAKSIVKELGLPLSTDNYARPEQCLLATVAILGGLTEDNIVPSERADPPDASGDSLQIRPQSSEKPQITHPGVGLWRPTPERALYAYVSVLGGQLVFDGGLFLGGLNQSVVTKRAAGQSFRRIALAVGQSEGIVARRYSTVEESLDSRVKHVIAPLCIAKGYARVAEGIDQSVFAMLSDGEKEFLRCLTINDTSALDYFMRRWSDGRDSSQYAGDILESLGLPVNKHNQGNDANLTLLATVATLGGFAEDVPTVGNIDAAYYSPTI